VKRKLLVIGQNGKMGTAILSVAQRENKFKIISKITGSLRPDVVVDFSSPELLAKTIETCLKYRCQLVLGTTGLSKAHFNLIKRAAKEIPIVYSSNMSPGMNFLFHILSQIKALKGFEFSIEETHHIHKKDRPSGTAKSMRNEIMAALPKAHVNVKSIREGEVFGDHVLDAKSNDEHITIKHSAFNRQVFARGALQAAHWLKNQKSGLFNMKDVLGLI
jgi:4-hydroxy-tetrahydrodipicolinate reductase